MKQYFQAIAAGNASDALGYGQVAPSSTDGMYLTGQVLHEQLSLGAISDISVGSTSTGPSGTQVAVSYTVRFADGRRTVTDEVPVVKHGSSWRLSQVGVPVTLSTSGPGADRLSFAGRPVPTARVTVFPGAIPVGTDNRAVAVADDPLARFVSSGQSVPLNPDLTKAARTSLATALQNALQRCLAATSTDPLCPMVTGGRPVPGSLHGTLTRSIADSSPDIELATSGGGVVTLSAEADIDATWKIWTFENIQESRSEKTTVTVTAQASVSDLDTVYWVPSDD